MKDDKQPPFKSKKKDSLLSFRLSKDLVKKAKALNLDIPQVLRDALETAIKKAESKDAA